MGSRVYRVVVCVTLFVLLPILLGGCKAGGLSNFGLPSSSKSGIVVDVLMPPKLAEWEGCGRPTLILVNVDKSSEASKRDLSRLKQIAKAKLDDVPFFTRREMVDGKANKGVNEVVAAHHFLTFRIDTLKLKVTKDESAIIATVDTNISATMKKSNGDATYIACGTKIYRDTVVTQLPIQDAAELPTKDALTYQAMEQVVDMVIRQISPKRLSLYRSLRSGSGCVGKAGALIDGDNCDMALEILEEEIAKSPDNEDALYNAGVAYEGLARKAHTDDRIKYLAKAYGMYRDAIKAGDDGEDVMTASAQVNQTLRFYLEAKSNGAEAVRKLNNNEPLEFMGTIE